MISSNTYIDSSSLYKSNKFKVKQKFAKNAEFCGKTIGRNESVRIPLPTYTTHGILLNFIPIRITTIFKFLDLNQLNENHQICLNHLELNLQKDPTHSHPKMLFYILMRNSINVRAEDFSQNILTQHSNFLKRLLVIHSFPPILQILQMHTFLLRLILTIHFVFDYIVNSPT